MLRIIAAVLAAAALATPAVAAAPPVQAHLADVRCQDMSPTVAMVPELQAELPDLGRVPVVTYRITAGEKAPLTEFELKVNGETKGSGDIGAKGVVEASTSIPNDQEVTVAVVSEDKTLATRTYHPSC